jgi:hypothetical protein
VAMRSSLCPPCSREWHAWLDWTLPPPPVRLISIGNDRREIAWRQEARYREWRDTVLFQQGLIERQCAGHCAEAGVPSRAVERVELTGALL